MDEQFLMKILSGISGMLITSTCELAFLPKWKNNYNTYPIPVSSCSNL